MSWRFRKRIGLGRFLHLNLSRSGVSVSTGIPGLTFNTNRRGTMATASLPGSGISYRTRRRPLSTSHRSGGRRVTPKVGFWRWLLNL